MDSIKGELQRLFHNIYESTKNINQLLEKMDEDMDRNDTQLVVQLNDFIEKRGQDMKRVDQIKAETTEAIHEIYLDVQLRQKLQEMEQNNNEKLQRLFQAFTKQYKKLQQGKKLTQYYHSNNENSYSDGVFIDKKN